MDLFGHKRIAELREDLAQADESNTIAQERITRLETKNRELANQVEYLVRTIRDMDQEIWNMGQKTDWNQQRPHFRKLHDEMTARKVAESKRIGDVLRGEIIDTYSPSKQIGSPDWNREVNEKSDRGY